MKYRTLLFIVIIMSSAVGIWAEPSDFPSSRSGWLALLNSGLDETLSVIGGSYKEIPAGDYSRRADRIVFYQEGLTLWSSDGKIVQFRIDSGWNGMISGIKAGMNEEELKLVIGEPWIEESESLYYNLPWNEGPVRLRFVFYGNGLSEAYFYLVR